MSRNRRIQQKIIGEAFQVGQALLRAEGLPTRHGYPPRLVRLLSPLREALLGTATTAELRDRVQAIRRRNVSGKAVLFRGHPWPHRGQTYAWCARRGFEMALVPFRAPSGPLTRPGPPGSLGQLSPIQIEIPVGADCEVEIIAQQELLGAPSWSLHVYPQAALTWGGVTCEGIRVYPFAEVPGSRLPDMHLDSKDLDPWFDTGLLGDRFLLPPNSILVGQRFYFRFRNSSPFPVQLQGAISLVGIPIPPGGQILVLDGPEEQDGEPSVSLA